VYDASGTDGVGIGIRQRHAATARQPKSSAAVCSLPRTVHGARGLEIDTSSAGADAKKGRRLRHAAQPAKTS